MVMLALTPARAYPLSGAVLLDGFLISLITALKQRLS